MGRGGTSRVSFGRVAHGGLLALYTLAAVLGLFLHSAGEVFRPHHTCDAGSSDLDREDAPDRSQHDEAGCALCHTHDQLSVVLLDSPVPLGTDLDVSGAVPPPAAADVAATRVRTVLSRAPPARPAHPTV